MPWLAIHEIQAYLNCLKQDHFTKERCTKSRDRRMILNCMSEKHDVKIRFMFKQLGIGINYYYYENSDKPTMSTEPRNTSIYLHISYSKQALYYVRVMSYKLTICCCIFKGAIKFPTRVHSYSSSSQTVLIPLCMVSFEMLILAD